ncbi:hypothetical protein PR048_027288 [Dryococelus australis]|uniref:Uncharacterized protein n=1 Tax=Dryococelus australis TaxID=614101 RepID=A0ABQ9GG95_9NEOP|nr:hypothetical protein PR048_027288 [Dryococelus australis]
MTERPEPKQRLGSQEAAVAGGSEYIEVRTPAPRPRKRDTTIKRDGGPTPARRKTRSKRLQDEPHQSGKQSETVITAVLGDLQDDIVEGLAGDIELGGECLMLVTYHCHAPYL